MKVLELMRTITKDEQLPATMAQIQYCIKNYEPSGRKRRKRLLSGTFFNKEKARNPNRAKGCASNVIIYCSGSLNGTFPHVA